MTGGMLRERGGNSPPDRKLGSTACCACARTSNGMHRLFQALYYGLPLKLLYIGLSVKYIPKNRKFSPHYLCPGSPCLHQNPSSWRQNP